MTPDPGWLEGLPTRLMAEMSLWSADLAGELARTAPYADLYHIDAADGHFAPAMLFFPDLVAGVRRRTVTPIHVHLMVADDILGSQIEQFVEAGADLVSVHAENGNAGEALALIEARGAIPGLVLKLDTAVALASPHLARIRCLTLLGTAIGVKGQHLAPEAEGRLREARALVAGVGRRVVVAADGGIRDTTVPGLRRAGAETVVMGSLAFGAPDLAGRMTWVRGLA